MPTVLETEAIEQSTYVITPAFTDEDGAAVVPDSVTWSLVKADGTIVNDKEDEPETPAASIDILLSGDDLAILDGADREQRYLVVEFIYDSTLGANLPGKDMAIFRVRNLKKVT